MADVAGFVLSAIGEGLGLGRLTTTAVTFTLVALAATAAAVFSRTTQRLVVTDGGLELSWITTGREWHHRRLTTHALRTESLQIGRLGLRLSDASGHADVHVDSLLMAEWVRRELVESIHESRQVGPPGARVHCAGCGGRLATQREMEAAGGITCPHCGTGLVATRGAVILGPAVIIDELPETACETARRQPARGASDAWTQPAWIRREPFTTLIAIAVGLAPAVAAGWSGLWVLHSIGRFPFSAIVAAVALGVYTTFVLRSTLGTHRVVVDETALLYAVTTGPCTWRRTRVPLARIVQVRARATPIGHELLLRTATGEQTIEVPAGGVDGAEALRGLLDVVARRLEALGRTVERRSGR